MPNTIRLNPSWSAAGRILLECVKYGETPEAKDNAAEEIMRALAGYDAMLEKHTDYFDTD